LTWGAICSNLEGVGRRIPLRKEPDEDAARNASDLAGTAMKGLLRYLGRGPRRRPSVLGAAATLAFVAGGLLVVWSAYIHFHLWGEPQGYRQLSVIGPLFLLQAIGGLVVGILLVAVRRVWIALAGIGYAVSTAIGFLLCVALPKGLFNFKETWQAPFAHLAFVVEVAIVVVLLIAGALCLIGAGPPEEAVLSPSGGDRRKDRSRV
jgi:hypothetical protein